MWYDTIWNNLFTERPGKSDPVKEHMDHYCRCYARGELSRDDFEELKRDLQEYEKKIKAPKNENKYPRCKHGKNDT